MKPQPHLNISLPTRIGIFNKNNSFVKAERQKVFVSFACMAHDTRIKNYYVHYYNLWLPFSRKIKDDDGAVYVLKCGWEESN